MDTQIILSIILTSVIFLYVTQIIPLELTSIIILPVLAFFCPFMTMSDILSGVSSPATITIICMFILSAGLLKSGSLDSLSEFLSKQAKKSFLRFMLCLAIVIPILSAFVNNTPLVVMMVPVVIAVARDNSIMPSKLLIPLSFFAILGGTCTLIGTNTNILISQLYADMTGEKGFTMFEFAPMGITYMIIGIAFILIFGIKLLPNRTSLSALMSRKDTAKYVTELCVPKESNFCGKTIKQAFGKDSKIKILEVVRNEKTFYSDQLKDLELEKNDIIIIEANIETISKHIGKNLDLPDTIKEQSSLKLQSVEIMMDEAVVLPDSKFVGITLDKLKLNKNFGVMVLGIQRGGRHHRRFLNSMQVRAGDVLLLQSNDQGFERLKNSKEVLLLDNPKQANKNKTHAYIAMAIMLGLVGAASFTSVPFVVLSIVACILMFAFKIIDFSEGFESVDLKVVLLLVGAIPLGVAMQKSLMAENLANDIFNMLGTMPSWVFLSVFYLLTSVLTAVLSNHATGVLLTPIAMQFAASLGVDPKPFLMAICFGASASFMTPVGYATNTIVMGPGGYKFIDYIKIGLPLNILLWIVATLLIPVFYPF